MFSPLWWWFICETYYNLSPSKMHDPHINLNPHPIHHARIIFPSCKHSLWARGLGVHGGNEARPWKHNVVTQASSLQQQNPGNSEAFSWVRWSTKIKSKTNSSIEWRRDRNEYKMGVSCLPEVPPATGAAASQKQVSQMFVHQGWYLVLQLM